LFFLVFGLLSTSAFAQWTNLYHQSNLPFVGVNKQLNDRWMQEFRAGIDNYIEDLSFE
jgi:hypothetical protein